MTDYAELASLMRATADLLERRGQWIEQRFHDWQRIERIPSDSSRGGGGGAPPADAKEERAASRTLHQWRNELAELRTALGTIRALDRVAFPPGTKLEHSQMTTAQIEADGWCGSHWRIREFVAIAKRPSGEPFYRGRCRRCGEWPGGDPPIEVLKTWRNGSTVRVAAS